MNVFLFMYPIMEFLDPLIKEVEMGFRVNGYKTERMDGIVHARYRERNYEFYWLLFSEEDAPETADGSRMKNDIFTIDSDDHLIASGVSFRKHVDENIYPDPEYILAQLPAEMDSLVIGGFHLDDCVDRLAFAAHKKGISVKVDEDVTDHFFAYTILCGEIPLVREKYPSLDELVFF